MSLIIPCAGATEREAQRLAYVLASTTTTSWERVFPEAADAIASAFDVRPLAYVMENTLPELWDDVLAEESDEEADARRDACRDIAADLFAEFAEAVAA